VEFGLQQGPKTIPGGRTSNGKSPADIHVESVTWFVPYTLLSRTEMSPSEQWDAVNDGRTGPPGCLALARRAGWSAVHVGRHVK